MARGEERAKVRVYTRHAEYKQQINNASEVRFNVCKDWMAEGGTARNNKRKKEKSTKDENIYLLERVY